MDRCYRVGVDIGGMFTDLVLVDDATGERAIGKILTTPKGAAAFETMPMYHVSPYPPLLRAQSGAAALLLASASSPVCRDENR